MYVRNQQPQLWNECLDALRGTDSSTSTKAPSPAPEPTPSVAVAPAPPPVTETKKPEYINGDVSAINPEHVHMVEQPAPTSVPSSTPQAKVYVPPFPLPSQPGWTWTLLDGTAYHDVVIDKVDADSVVIRCDEGVKTLHMMTLNTDLQRMLGYDPELGEALRKQKQEQQAQGTP